MNDGREVWSGGRAFSFWGGRRWGERPWLVVLLTCAIGVDLQLRAEISRIPITLLASAFRHLIDPFDENIEERTVDNGREERISCLLTPPSRRASTSIASPATTTSEKYRGRT